TTGVSTECTPTEARAPASVRTGVSIHAPERQPLPSSLRDIELVFDVTAPTIAERFSPLRIAQQLHYPLSCTLHVTGRNNVPGLLIQNKLVDTRTSSQYHRTARCHRLLRGIGQTLALALAHGKEYLRRGGRFLHPLVGNMPVHDYCLPQLALGNHVPDMLRLRPVSE